jgi:hypothetical protein
MLAMVELLLAEPGSSVRHAGIYLLDQEAMKLSNISPSILQFQAKSVGILSILLEWLITSSSAAMLTLLIHTPPQRLIYCGSKLETTPEMKESQSRPK